MTDAALHPPAIVSARRAVTRDRRALLADGAVMLALAAAVMAIFTPYMLALNRGIFFWLDHNQHQGFAQAFAATGTPPAPHFLYHLIVIGLYHLTGGVEWRLASALAMTLPQIATVLIAYALLRAPLSGLPGWRTWIGRGLCAGLALAVMLVVPPFWLQSVDGKAIDVNLYLLGFITPTTLHNPTQTLLRPLALLLFAGIAAYALGSRITPTRRAAVIAIGLAALVIIGGLSKPNYLLAVLPALAVWSGVRLLLRRRIAWLPVVVGVGVPGAALLTWQYLFTFTQSSSMGTSSIVFDPLTVLTTITPLTPGDLLVHALISLLFPALIYGFGGRAAWRDPAFNFAWLTLAFGAAFMYLLAETGPRFEHANFVWNAYSAMFILDFAAIHFSMRDWRRRTGGRRIDWRFAGALLLIGALVVQGVVFLIAFVAWVGSLNVVM